MSKKRPEPPSPAQHRPRRKSAIDGGFDHWLDRQLHKIYDPVLDERIPDDLARLLEGFAKRDHPDDADRS